MNKNSANDDFEKKIEKLAAAADAEREAQVDALIMLI